MCLKIKITADNAPGSSDNETMSPGREAAKSGGVPGAGAGGGTAATQNSCTNSPMTTQSKQTVKGGDAAGRKISNTFDEVGQA